MIDDEPMEAYPASDKMREIKRSWITSKRNQHPLNLRQPFNPKTCAVKQAITPARPLNPLSNQPNSL